MGSRLLPVRSYLFEGWGVRPYTPENREWALLSEPELTKAWRRRLGRTSSGEAGRRPTDNVTRWPQPLPSHFSLKDKNTPRKIISTNRRPSPSESYYNYTLILFIVY